MTGPAGHSRRFLLLWIAQTVSLVGSQLTAFGLGVWVYQRTQSTMMYSLVALANLAPRVIFAPLMGGFVDRRDLRSVLIAGHVGAGVCSLAIALLFGTGLLEVLAIIGLVAIGATFNAIHLPAFSKVTAVLVPPEELGKANGLAQLGVALGYLVAPLLAGFLMPHIEVLGILVIDISSFLFAVAVLSAVRLPLVGAPTGHHSSDPLLFLRDAAEGWSYIRARRGLLILLLLITAMSFNLGMVQVLITPLMLSFASVQVLSIVLFVGGMGMVVGSVAMMAWGGPQRRIHGVLGFLLLQGVFLLVGSLQASAPLVAAGAFGVLLSVPLITACDQSIWQRLVPTDIHGRVMAVHSAVSGASVPVAYLLAGPLADSLFEPWMAPGGTLAASAGQLIGVGQGRGIALLFAVLGFGTFLFVSLGALSASLRRVEDAAPEPSAPAEPSASPLGAG
ncbi:MFS transporter [Archangium lansingense]|uniref:MFS transporter n=1 Tax=Archangium lansingense TaxID=2995310 RepID=A0ABT4ABJ8_9BACT|nr:MFS transporter [Archangium lansinium]MCY1079000.1 MFS transporter [Archangium lansinium]